MFNLSNNQLAPRDKNFVSLSRPELIVIYEWHTHPQIYMNLTTVFLNHGLPKPCFILCNWAMESMLKMIYINERKSIFLPLVLTFEDLLILFRLESGIDIEALCLYESGKLLANSSTFNSTVYKCSKPHLQLLIKKVDDLLCRLSPRVVNSTVEMYTSIFK